MTQILANIALVFAFTGALAFVVVYQVFANWSRTAVGRNVMAFMFLVSVLLLLAVLRNFVPGIEHHIQTARLISYTLVGLVIWHRVYLLVRAQRLADPRGRHERNSH